MIRTLGSSVQHSLGDLLMRRNAGRTPSLCKPQRSIRSRPAFVNLGRLPCAVGASLLAASLLVYGSPRPEQGAPLSFASFAAVEQADLPQCEPRTPEPIYPPLSSAARSRAEEARAAVQTVPADSEVVREREETKRLLALLGYQLSGRARIHIEDVDGKHGGEVLRAGVATSSLAASAEVTLNTTLPSEYFLEHVTKEDAARIRQNWADIDRMTGGEITADRVGEIGATWLEQSIYQVAARVKRVQDDLPAPWDGRRTFVNMSFVTNPYFVTKQLAEKLVRSPQGSPAYVEVERALGHAPRVDRSCTPGRPDQQDVRAVMERIVQPRIAQALAEPDAIAKTAVAREHLEQTLRRARQVGIIVFKSAGNEHALALQLTRNGAYALDAVAGSALLIEVCAVDLAGPGRADDRMAGFSSAGDVCAAGVDVPVGAGRIGSNMNGTSFASPIEVESAWVIDALVPALTEEQLIDLLLHPHANTPVNGSQAGRTDLFAVALLALHPSVDRATIDAIRTSLLRDPSPENAAKMRALCSGA